VGRARAFYLICKDLCPTHKQSWQDFSWYKTGKNVPKRGRIYQMAIKHVKWPENWPHGHTIPIPTSSIARPSKVYTNWEFWFEKKRSGNSARIVNSSSLNQPKPDAWSRSPTHLCNRVARWFVFKPKNQIWVNFGGSCNGRRWYILLTPGSFYGLLLYFMDI
jgi:hypothetical protein